MQSPQHTFSSPLTIIATFAAIIEASALASLPFLDNDSQAIYTWFLVGFPPFLTLLFFVTLNFNYKALYSPSDYHNEHDFLKAMIPLDTAATQADQAAKPDPAFVLVTSTDARKTVQSLLINCLNAKKNEINYSIIAWDSKRRIMKTLVTNINNRA